MARRLTFLAGFAAGYVLGARAGRERYEQIAGKAREVWHDPRVQQKAEQAEHLARQKAEQAGHLAQEKAGEVGHAVAEKVTSGKDQVTHKRSGTGDGEPPRGS